MRILVISNLYPPNEVGGYERLCFEVSSALAEMGHEITVLTSDYGSKWMDFPQQLIVRKLRLLIGENIYNPYPGSPEEREAVNASNVECVVRHLRKTQPDVVFAWNLFFLDPSFLDAVQRNAPRTVLMLTDNWLLMIRNPLFMAEYFRMVVHGTEPFVPPLLPSAWGRAAGLAKRLLGRTSAKRDRSAGELEAVFGSTFMRDLYAVGGSTFPRHQVINNGVRQSRGEEVRLPDRGRLVRCGVLRLLFAGRLVDLKGAHTAVEAMSLLDHRVLGVERVELTLLGDTQDNAYVILLNQAVEQSGCADRITMLEPVAENELPALFADHDVYLFPSLYEPFSLTLIHALALGIPTIASDVGGNVEIITDGESGLLFHKGDGPSLARQVARLATDPALRIHLSEGGRKSASRFTFERMVGAMAAYLEPNRTR